MKQCLLGVDIGTSNIKAVAYSTSGAEIWKATTPTVTHYPRPDWAYFEPDEIWTAVCSVLRQVMDNLPPSTEPAAIAFTSMGEAAVPLDANGKAVYPIIAWFDRRTTPQSEWWQQEIGADQTAAICGLPVKSIFGILKLMWLKDNQPQLFPKIRHWLHMADFGAYRLCNEQATDYSLASRTMVLDLKEKTWSLRLLEQCGIPADLLCQLVPSGIQLGTVHKEAAAETGLPVGLPVCSGGHDHLCGALALGTIEPGDVFDSMGTAESLLVTTREPALDPSITSVGIGQGIHVVPNCGYAMGGIYFSGGCIDWIRQVLTSALPGAADTNQSFDHLIELAQQVPPGSGGAFFLPHLRQANPPITDPLARGAFVGLSSDTGPGHLARAVIEGVAYEYQRAYDSMMEAFALTPRRLLATGGGTRNTLLMETKAAISGAPLTVANVDEATCLGAAMLAGIGIGAYSTFEDAVAQIQYVTQNVQYRREMHEFYQVRFREIYTNLYDALKEVNWQISRLIE